VLSVPNSQYAQDQLDAKRDIEDAGRKVLLITPADVDAVATATGVPVFAQNRFKSSYVQAAVANVPEDTEQEIWILQTKFESEEIDGSNVRVTDLRFLVPGDVDLSSQMTIQDGSNTYQIINIMPVQPGDLVILYKVQCR